ncbi:leucine-rich repeat protein SHOC-2-like [Saccostrea echinata]|uniref:leucine-rich repeat protein SHOC-2-like n=1 Tax=Saccostrea echinata TaxID=191078 RepID=UPI002A83D0A2|nr:leucine-rich repeat protein SHOC-2-like [Saccostrea echinata]
MSYDYLDLSYNRILNIQSYQFRGTHFKEIYLQGNNLQNISLGAFEDVENTLLLLDLSNNKLRNLPPSLADLHSLETLDITHNPLTRGTDYTESVMRALGDTLTDLKIGSETLTSWPTSLHHLPILNRLTVASLSRFIRDIGAESFHGFETTLQYLNIKNTYLLAVPIAISKLKNLKELHFDQNPYVTDRGVLIQAFPLNSPYLQTLSLNRDSLTEFPRVLRYLPALKNFSLDDKNLRYLSDLNIGDLRTVTNLTLRNCSLLRVPAALSQIRYLKVLDLSLNGIVTIDTNDMKDLRYLEAFIIRNSSLKYISENAFGRVPRLKTLDFRSTHLTSVPKAINTVWPCLEKVLLDENKVDCMCETLVWLREKRDTCVSDAFPMKIEGHCDTIHDTIEHYIEEYIPRCPEYKELHNIPPYNRTA